MVSIKYALTLLENTTLAFVEETYIPMVSKRCLPIAEFFCSTICAQLPKHALSSNCLEGEKGKTNTVL